MKRIRPERRSVPALALMMAVTMLAFTSCGGRKSDTDRKELIPAAEMVTLLAELYLTDGLMAVPEVFIVHQEKDSLKVYEEVVGNHGYTLGQVDKTLEYYFINNPKKLQKMYNEALSRLTELESMAQAETEREVPVIENLWPGRLSFALPEDGITEKIYFDYSLRDTGMYTLSISVILFPDDQSVNPRITVWFWKPDSTEAGTSFYWNETPLQKDGNAHYHTISAYTPDSSFTNIRGWLLNHDPKEGRWEKHARIESVRLIRKDFSIEQ
ncbi:MAG: DUF4296 domain-containing protein [Bacteroidales bacterium]|jgi:hypothetical protein|nr:DUF4296 domain-containing protein [Bacteroidales bacterium]